MATVNMRGVSKFYDTQCILQNINLNIEKGEFVAVVGPSGCGKSTLLRLVAGLDSVSSGNILINNQCVNETPPAARDMAMVFQNYALYPHMTVYNNMAYGLKMRGMKKYEIQQRVEEVAKMLHLEDYLYKKPIVLSGGQRQRVAMGRAIVRSPAVFLFDEPLSNLDAKLRTEMRYEIKKLHQQLGTTCLYVTHDQTEAMTMADKIVVLNKGKIEQIGTPRELYQSPSTVFVASFMGHYSMNFLPATIDLQRQMVEIGVGKTLPLPRNLRTDHTAVLIGIRPEHLYFNTEPNQESIFVHVKFIEDMGADKIVRVVTEKENLSLALRIPGDMPIINHRLAINIESTKANLFCQQTGNRLGGWSE